MNMQVLKSYLDPLKLVLSFKYKKAQSKKIFVTFDIILKFYEFDYFGNRTVNPLSAVQE